MSIITLTVKMVVKLPDGVDAKAIAPDWSSSEAWLVLNGFGGDEVWAGRAESEWITKAVEGEEQQPS